MVGGSDEKTLLMHQNVYYVFFATYLMPFTIVLAAWMVCMPIRVLRLLPAQALNFINRLLPIPKKGFFGRFFKFTTFLLVGAGILLALEYFTMQNQEMSYQKCKKQMRGVCHYEKSLKWRSERNFYMFAINFLLVGLIDTFTRRQEEEDEINLHRKRVDEYFEVFSQDVSCKEAIKSFNKLHQSMQDKGFKVYLEFRIKCHNLFAALDADGNEKLSKEELRTIHGSEGQLALFFEHLDSDKSDNLDESEFVAYFASLEERKGEGCVKLVLDKWLSIAQEKVKKQK
jgi:Ca2+-binding EF-hand superfamily protein